MLALSAFVFFYFPSQHLGAADWSHCSGGVGLPSKLGPGVAGTSAGGSVAAALRLLRAPCLALLLSFVFFLFVVVVVAAAAA